MAPCDRPDAPMTVATLTSSNGLHRVELELLPIAEPRHSEWHGYGIHMVDARTGERWSLASTDEHTLFLDKTYDPEALAVCAGLRRAVRTGEPYCFTPADERDFEIEVTPRHDGVWVRLQFDVRPAPSRFKWPEGTLVEAQETLRFADALEGSFRALLR